MEVLFKKFLTMFGAVTGSITPMNVTTDSGMTAEMKGEILSVQLLNGDEWINVDIALRTIR